MDTQQLCGGVQLRQDMTSVRQPIGHSDQDAVEYSEHAVTIPRDYNCAPFPVENDFLIPRLQRALLGDAVPNLTVRAILVPLSSYLRHQSSHTTWTDLPHRLGPYLCIELVQAIRNTPTQDGALRYTELAGKGVGDL